MDLGAKDVAVPDHRWRRATDPGVTVDCRRPPDRAPGGRSPLMASSSGASAIDTSMLTGESVPVEVGPGTPPSATLNARQPPRRRTRRVWAPTQLARRWPASSRTPRRQAQVQRLADRISGIFVPIDARPRPGDAHLPGWSAAPGPPWSSPRPSPLLIIACPCVLGLATDRPHGRHRARRPTRHPHQGPRVPDPPARSTRSCSTRRAP